MNKKYEVLESKEVYSCRVFKVREDEVRLPDGNDITRQLVVHPGSVAILPRLSDGRLLLISQYRHAVGDSIIEFPAGTLEAGEEPLECAKREIREEVGYAAKDWDDLGEVYPSPGICTEVMRLYFASDLYPEKLKGDDDEIIDMFPMSVKEVEQSIVDGRINDCKTIALYFRAKAKGLLG